MQSTYVAKAKRQFIISCINPNYCVKWKYMPRINGNLFAVKPSPHITFI